MTTALLILLAIGLGAPPAPATPTLARTFVLDGVTGPADSTGIVGRIDHMAYDPESGRLFVACLAHGSLQAIDLTTGKVVGRVGKLPRPQGAWAAGGRVFVATGTDGRVRAFDARTLKPLGSAPVGADADNVRVGSDSQVWVSFGGNGPGGLAPFDPKTLAPGQVVATPRMPEGFRLDPAGGRAYANLPAGKRSTADGSVVALKLPGGEPLWERKFTGRSGNFPMTLDAQRGRLFVVTRRPARVIAISTADGKILGEAACPPESDDLFVDPRTGRVVVIGGGSPPKAGEPGGDGASLGVFDVDAGGNPTRLGGTPLPPHSRTGAIAADRGVVYVAVPPTAGQPAEIREYRVPR